LESDIVFKNGEIDKLNEIYDKKDGK